MKIKSLVCRVRPLLPLIAIVILGAGVYHNVVSNEFVWDDAFLISGNKHIRNWSHTPDIFCKSFGDFTDGRFNNYYRPLQIFTYLLEYRLWKLKPFGYHLTNVILHVGVALLIFWLVMVLFNKRWLAFLAGIFFVAHPIHVGAVAYISGRADPLSAIFFLLSLIFYIKHCQGQNTFFLILSFFGFIGALFSRENTLILPVLIIFYHFCFQKKVSLAKFFPFLGISVFYVIMRLKVITPLASVGLDRMLQKLPERLTTIFAGLQGYVRVLIVPLNLHMEYGQPLFIWANFEVIAGIIIFCLLTVLIYLTRKNKVLLFGFGWFFITLIPHSNIYRLGQYMAEHWLYIPSIGFFIILGYLFYRIFKLDNKKLSIISSLALAALLIFYSFLTYKQNEYWKNNLVFYERTLKYAPNSGKILNNLGSYYTTMKKTQEALDLYRRALKNNYRSPNLYSNIGRLYNMQDEPDKAIWYYQQAIKLSPKKAKYYFNLGTAYQKKRDYKKATDSYKKVLTLDPDYSSADRSLGSLAKYIGRVDGTIEKYKIILQKTPEDLKTHEFLASLYKSLGRYKEAAEVYEKLLIVKPESTHFNNSLGIVYYWLGDNERACKAYARAIELNPRDATVYYNLALSYNALKKCKEAIEALEKTLEIDPLSLKACDLLSRLYFREKDSDKGRFYRKRADELSAELILPPSKK